MPERRIDTELWTHPDFQELCPSAKLLYLYSWSNGHCTAAGIYRISLKTVAFETGLPLGDIPQLMAELVPMDVEWIEPPSVIWVKKFLKHQSKSPKFLDAVVAALGQISDRELVDDFLLYNRDIMVDLPMAGDIGLTRRECVAIRDRFVCAYCGKEITVSTDYEMDHIVPVSKKGATNYANLVASCRACNQKKLDRLPEDAGFMRPQANNFHAAQALYVLKNDQAIRDRWLAVFPQRVATSWQLLTTSANKLQQVEHSLDSDSDSDSDSVKTQTQYSGVDRVFLDSMKQRFPAIDVDAEWQDCQTWWAEHRKKMRAPQSALTNWLKKIQAKLPPIPPPDAPRPILR
jgi:hypothetical protein